MLKIEMFPVDRDASKAEDTAPTIEEDEVQDAVAG
jgi:hypothetical protein